MKVEAVGYKALEKVQSAPNMLPDPATALTGEEERNQRKSAELLRKRNLLILGIVLTLPVVVLSMFLMIKCRSKLIKVDFDLPDY